MAVLRPPARALRGCLVSSSRRALSSQPAPAVGEQPQPTGNYLYPMTHLAAPNALKIVAGEGIYVTDASGRTRLEAMAGLWCVGLGWGRPELIEAARSQMERLSYYHTYARTNDEVERLTDRLLGMAPKSLKGGAVFYGSGGGDANEAQVRIAWLANATKGDFPEKRAFVSRQRAYHGSSVASGSLTGLSHVSGPSARSGLPVGAICAAHVRCPHYFREALDGETEAAFVQRCADELDATLTELNARETVAAMILEPVQGAGGVVVPPDGYLKRVTEICANHDVKVIADEVITGFGRTGAVWGCETLPGLEAPNAISAAKQLTSAYVPFSAAIVDAETADLLKSAPMFSVGYTYSGHPLGAAVANAALDVYEGEGLFGVADWQHPVGARFKQRLASFRGGRDPLVAEVRHHGLLGALELTNDPSGKRGPVAFDDPNAGKLGKLAAAKALDRDLIVRAVGDAVCLCPPLVITVDQVDELFDKLEATLDDTVVAAADAGLLVG